MSKCAAITAKGAQCKGLVKPGNEYCPAHDPGRQEARRRAASKAGKAKPNRELIALKARIHEIADEVYEGTLHTSRGNTLAALYNVLLRVVEVELQVREQMELVGRLEELETLLEEKGSNRWAG